MIRALVVKMTAVIYVATGLYDEKINKLINKTGYERTVNRSVESIKVTFRRVCGRRRIHR